MNKAQLPDWIHIAPEYDNPDYVALNRQYKIGKRILAVILLTLGLCGWFNMLGYQPLGLPPFQQSHLNYQIFTIVITVFLLFTATGLWLDALWGVLMGALTTLFSSACLIWLGNSVFLVSVFLFLFASLAVMDIAYLLQVRKVKSNFPN